MARSLRKNDSTMLMYSLAVRMRDTDLPPAHAAAVNSFRMSRASFLVGSPMMRDLSAASSGPDRESYILASVFLPLRWMGSGLMSSPWRSWWSRCRSLANTRGRDAGGVCRYLLGPIRPTNVPWLPVYVSRSRLTVRMDFHGTRMRSCGVHRRGSGGTFALGRPVFAAMRLRYGGWDCCEPKRKKLRGAHTGNDTMGAAPVPASPSPSTRDEVARSENLPEPYRGPSRAIVAPQVRPPARPARENGGFPTPPQEKDRREE